MTFSFSLPTYPHIQMKKPVLIVLIGPTGVGKTELSLSIAEKYHTSIISSDSRQLYKDLKIGTAAPTPDQLKRVPHYFVGTLELTDYYSAAQFEAEVLRSWKSYSGLIR